MKRIVLVILALAAVAAVPATAKAAVPCRDRIYNDWYADGKVATTYPIACYRDALKHLQGRSDIDVYSSMKDDIRAAMQGALAKSKGDTKVPVQIGNAGPTVKPHSDRHQTSANTPPHDPAGQGETTTTLPDTSTVAVSSTSGNGGSVPVPLLVLGGLALLLTAVGGIGIVAKRRRL